VDASGAGARAWTTLPPSSPRRRLPGRAPEGSLSAARAASGTTPTPRPGAGRRAVAAAAGTQRWTHSATNASSATSAAGYRPRSRMLRSGRCWLPTDITEGKRTPTSRGSTASRLAQCQCLACLPEHASLRLGRHRFHLACLPGVLPPRSGQAAPFEALAQPSAPTMRLRLICSRPHATTPWSPSSPPCSRSRSPRGWPHLRASTTRSGRRTALRLASTPSTLLAPRCTPPSSPHAGATCRSRWRSCSTAPLTATWTPSPRMASIPHGAASTGSRSVPASTSRATRSSPSPTASGAAGSGREQDRHACSRRPLCRRPAAAARCSGGRRRGRQRRAAREGRAWW